MASAAKCHDGALTTVGVNSVTTFKCGHPRTNANSIPHAKTTRCRICAARQAQERKQAHEKRAAAIVRLHIDGMSRVEIAGALSVSHSIVCKAIQRYAPAAPQLARDPLYSQRALQVAAREAGANVEQLRSNWRYPRSIIHARWAFMAAMRRRGASLPRIGKLLARDHSTISYGLARAQALRGNEEFEALLARVDAA